MITGHLDFVRKIRSRVILQRLDTQVVLKILQIKLFNTLYRTMEVPYNSRNFSLDKNFMYLCIAEILDEINFRQCDGGRHILYVITNMGQKNH